MQAEPDVAGHAQVREQGVILKDHADLPLLRCEMPPRSAHRLSTKQDTPLLQPLKACDQAQHRAFAAAGRAEQATNLASLEMEPDAFQHRVMAVAMGDSIKLQHAATA